MEPHAAGHVSGVQRVVVEEHSCLTPSDFHRYGWSRGSSIHHISRKTTVWIHVMCSARTKLTPAYALTFEPALGPLTMSVKIEENYVSFFCSDRVPRVNRR